MSDPQITNNREQSRYEAHVDGGLAGFAQYQLVGDDTIVFPHTVVEPQFEGQGIGGALVRTSLDDVRAEGTRKVVPRCSFYKGWIDRHEDYKDLVKG